MKKFFAMLLSLVMIMSLSVPAFAAETDTVTSTEENKNTATHNVTASYTPSSTEVSLDVMLKAIDGSTGTEITESIIGYQDFQAVDNGSLTSMTRLTGDYTVTFADGMVPRGYKTPADISLTIADTDNDGAGELTSNSSHAAVELVDGVYVITVTLEVESTEDTAATITGVSITVDNVEYTSGNVTITPDTQSIILTVTGTNLKNGTTDNLVWFVDHGSVPVAEDYGDISDDGTTATLSIDASEFANTTTAFEIKYSNDGGSTWIESGVYVIYQSETVSVDITWGAMSFTYSDEQVDGADKGWTCEDGANKITVTNTGDTAFNAQPIYTAKDGYEEIEGVFYESMEATTYTMFADLYSGGSFTFYLKLSNKPSKALDGDTIATVTIRITEGIGQ